MPAAFPQARGLPQGRRRLPRRARLRRERRAPRRRVARGEAAPALGDPRRLRAGGAAGRHPGARRLQPRRQRRRGLLRGQPARRRALERDQGLPASGGAARQPAGLDRRAHPPPAAGASRRRGLVGRLAPRRGHRGAAAGRRRGHRGAAGRRRRGDPRHRRHRHAADPAALRHRAGGAAARARHRGRARTGRRGREPAGPSADPRGIPGRGRHHAEYAGELVVGQGAHSPRIPLQAQRADEHGALAARRVHAQRPGATARQPRIPRAAALARGLRPAAARLPGLHGERLQPQPDEPRRGAHSHARQPGCAEHRAALPLDRRRPVDRRRVAAPDAAHRRAAGTGALQAARVQARRAVPERRRPGAPGRRHRHHHLPPGRHREDGPGRRSGRRGRRAPARARRGRPARGRCQRDAHHHQRQHQLADADDRRARRAVDRRGRPLPAPP